MRAFFCYTGRTVFFLFFLIVSASILSISSSAFGDGGGRMAINASLQGRDARLLVMITPPILTPDNAHDAAILFRLYDIKTNETIKFTSLFLSVFKDGKQLLAPDLFHSANGLLKLKIEPSAGESVIYANKEPHLNAWEADPGGVINLKAPILLQSGLYQIHIEVFGIDSPFNIFPQDDIPKFDVYLSVGDISYHNVYFNNRNYNLTLVSYYDKTENFGFDPAKREISWSMPFNYNLSRIQKEQDIFVHEEIRIPRALTEIANQTRFLGTVDGFELPPASIARDPYTSETELMVHFLINKDRIIDVVKSSPQIDKLGKMKFALSPSKESGTSIETSGTIISDTGNIEVALDWNPSPLSAVNPEKLTLKFYDQLSGKPIVGNVTYDFAIFPYGLPERSPIVIKQDRIAVNGTDSIDQIFFPANATFAVQIKINNVSSPDTNRTGTALGVVVVPEFGAMTLVAPSVGIASVLIILYRVRKILIE